jgi:Ca2+-binding EF-hand superfamily protein
MHPNMKIAFVLGATVLVGMTGVAYAHMDGPPPPDGPMQGLVHRSRLADRLLAEFDANKDGKITKAEFNNVLGTRFAAATHGAKFMSEDQFAAIHQGEFQSHAAEMFRRIDWNGDGRLTIDEFEAPQRAHFQMMDRDGTGTVSCNPAMHADFRAEDAPLPNSEAHGDRGDHGGGWGGHGGWGGRHGGFHRGGYSRGGGFGRAAFCGESDTSRDGKVTRAEFDQIMTGHFHDATGGQPFMTLAQFTAQMSVRYRDMNDHMFKRLDKDGDGKLSMAEFSAPPLKLFARLDRDNTGTVTADEMKPHFHNRGDDHGHGNWGRGHGDWHDKDNNHDHDDDRNSQGGDDDN